MALLVNGEKVKDAVIRKEVERLRPDYEKTFADMDPKEREAQLIDWSRENIVERTLLRQEIKNNESDMPNDQLESILARLKKKYEDPQELYKDFDAEDDEKIKELLELILKTERKFSELYKELPKPSQAEIEKFYKENKEQFRTAEQVRAAHIVKYVDWQSDEATAYNAIRQAQEQIKNGTPFEIVVDKYTDGPDSGKSFYYFTKGDDVEEFEDVIFNLGVGQVSDIFRTRFGFHIAKVYERKPGEIAGLKEVRSQIADELEEQMRQQVVEEFIDQLKSKAKIEEE